MGNAENHASRFEIRSPSGQLLCTVAVFGAFVSSKMNGKFHGPSRVPDKAAFRPEDEGRSPQRTTATEQPQTPRAQPAAKPDVNKQGVQASPGEPSMTDPQKRLLFRIMSDQGFEGDKAYEQLKKFFQVKSLKDVSKQEASRGIERLLAQVKGGSNGNRPSV